MLDPLWCAFRPSKAVVSNARGFRPIMFVLETRSLRAVLRICAAIGVAASIAAPAAASFPPKRFKATKEEMASRCESLGDRASYTDWDYKPGEYGCVDTKTGFVLICKEGTEVCKLYFPSRKFPPQPRKRMAVFNPPAREFRIDGAPSRSLRVQRIGVFRTSASA